MAYVDEARALLGRAVVAGRRATGSPEWPLAAASALGLLATLEVPRHVRDDNTLLSVVLLLALGATLPLALVRISAVAAAALITTATFLTVASGVALTFGGAIAQLAALYISPPCTCWAAGTSAAWRFRS